MTSGAAGTARGGAARFDDLRAGTALRFPAPSGVLIAHQPEEVAPVLDQVHRATSNGRWAFGFLVYEAAAGLDPEFAVHPPQEGLPLAWFGITDPPTQVPVVSSHLETGDFDVGWKPDWSPQEHRALVDRVRERIAAGETYQTNLTVRMRGSFSGDPAGLYRDLATAQCGAHNAYLDLGRFAIASASPELFFELRGDEVLLRPMKGTAPRGRDQQEDLDLERALRGCAKERAENVMIVDLMRNDVARVAVPGSVRVPSLLSVERYPTALQLTSDVVARLRPGTGLRELFRALFPCGSVTGAPKISTMHLIRELEADPRGVYCGAVGWVAPPSASVRARFNVAIRTAVVDRETGRAQYGTGGGITWSSDAAAEHRELLVKAEILRRSAVK
ncbi:aminodeoxychorismate synthase component I [Saccharopolyspora mangrovi]|uniref:Aminodeoxychorismate synthase component I n=1 Tax=Saccharopolyspora mangrovi TaxID=3082379 RepID=A0ABU6ADX0_9PSEU|nr:aminodeoxychorismate synthase component I [Saccharopolyspora sp. S2-29]MEB3369746.1 aminodeoxychorismate synthase component I [Saccharopolyspora sp. S2-29]